MNNIIWNCSQRWFLQSFKSHTSHLSVYVCNMSSCISCRQQHRNRNALWKPGEFGKMVIHHEQHVMTWVTLCPLLLFLSPTHRDHCLSGCQPSKKRKNLCFFVSYFWSCETKWSESCFIAPEGPLGATTNIKRWDSMRQTSLTVSTGEFLLDNPMFQLWLRSGFFCGCTFCSYKEFNLETCVYKAAVPSRYRPQNSQYFTLHRCKLSVTCDIMGLICKSVKQNIIGTFFQLQFQILLF